MSIKQFQFDILRIISKLSPKIFTPADMFGVLFDPDSHRDIKGGRPGRNLPAGRGLTFTPFR